MNNLDIDIPMKMRVKKPVEAIQCANTFSLLQRKMYNVLLANASGNLYSNATHRITMRTLCDLMGYRSNDYKTVKNRFRELRRMDIEWDVINENGNKVWTNTSPLSLARVIEGEGICEYEFTPSLVPFLDRPAQYAKFSLTIQAKFKSSYGIALYENCERYKNIGYTRAFDIPTFRKLMGVNASEYVEFFALKRRVINKAITEVNKYADFDVEAEYKKEGRAVVSIRFIIIRTKKNDITKIANGKVETDLDKKIEKYFAISKKEIDKYIMKYGENYVYQKVESILMSDSFKNGVIKNMAGYLKKALTEDYQSNISSKSIVEKDKIKKEKLVEMKRERERLEGKLKTDFDKYRTEELMRLLPTFSQKEQDILFGEFESNISEPYIKKMYRTKGLDDIFVIKSFILFLEQEHKEIMGMFQTSDEFVKKTYPNVRSEIQKLDEIISLKTKETV